MQIQIVTDPVLCRHNPDHSRGYTESEAAKATAAGRPSATIQRLRLAPDPASRNKTALAGNEWTLAVQFVRGEIDRRRPSRLVPIEPPGLSDSDGNIETLKYCKVAIQQYCKVAILQYCNTAIQQYSNTAIQQGCNPAGPVATRKPRRTSIPPGLVSSSFGSIWQRRSEPTSSITVRLNFRGPVAETTVTMDDILVDTAFGGTMADIQVDIDQDNLQLAKQLTGTTSDRETVRLALRTLITVRRQPSAVERIISRRFAPSQIDAPTVTPSR